MGSDTWGISGPAFLVLYAALAVVVWFVSTRARRARAEPATVRPTGDLSGHPQDIAYLNGGDELALFSALTSMHLRGTITSTKGTVRALGRAEGDELERAVHAAVGHPVHRTRLPHHRPVTEALAATRARLLDAGLLLSDEQRRHVRGAGFWMLGVAALGLVRLLAGVAEARPVGFLLLELTAVVAVAVWQLSHAPRRTGPGDRTLAELRSRHQGLAPSVGPDWTLYGPSGAALGVGIFGAAAVWASDPALAEGLAVQRVGWTGAEGGSAYIGGDGGGGDGGGGGGGGCGG